MSKPLGRRDSGKVLDGRIGYTEVVVVDIYFKMTSPRKVTGKFLSEVMYKSYNWSIIKRRNKGHAVAQFTEALHYKGRSRVRFPMVSVQFFVHIILPVALLS